MKAIFWTLVVSAPLLIGTGCRDQTDRAAEEVRKAQENVREQRDDVATEPAQMPDQTAELARAVRELAAARAAYADAVNGRLASIDARIARLAQDTTDNEAQATAARLRARRDEIATQLQQLDSQTAATWEEYTEGIEQRFDDIDRELDVGPLPPAVP